MGNRDIGQGAHAKKNMVVLAALAAVLTLGLQPSGIERPSPAKMAEFLISPYAALAWSLGKLYGLKPDAQRGAASSQPAADAG